VGPPRDDTIFAMASAAGRAGVAVLRLSGRHTAHAIGALTGRGVPPPRRAVLRRFCDPDSGEEIDRGLLLWFPAPASYTGEDVAELQVHGGRAVLAALLAALERRSGLRPAEPGEFTRRAFLNGRLDLSRAEAVADLVDAETAAQRRQALRQLDGSLGRQAEAWRLGVLELQAACEATIDFVEEADVAADLLERSRLRIPALRREMEAALAAGMRGERLREGFHVAILGAPNAGKSSLLNTLAGRDVAIVTALAGTTRDVLEVQAEIDGLPIVLADTAGLRETGDMIEREGVRRAVDRAGRADLRLLLVDATAPAVDPAVRGLMGEGALVVASKLDLAGGAIPAPLAAEGAELGVSVHSGQGVDVLLAALARHAASAVGGGALLTRARHRHALSEAAAALCRAEAAAEAEAVAEDLRLAARAVGRITGRVGVEDMLDTLFAGFCIGK